MFSTFPKIPEGFPEKLENVRPISTLYRSRRGILRKHSQKRRSQIKRYFISAELQDSGVAQCSFEGSSGSAAAVLGAELLDGASFGSNHPSKVPQMPEEMEVVSGEAIMSARTVRKRRIAGIFQHYYPEGNALFSI